MRRTLWIGCALALVGGQVIAGDRDDPWGVSPQPDASGLCLWLPLDPPRAEGGVAYFDALGNAAAILRAPADADPALVVSFYGAYLERLQRDGWTRREDLRVSLGGVQLPPIANPLETLSERGDVAFAPLPAGCDAFELIVPQKTGPLTLRVRRRSRRIKDAEPHLAAWTAHATSDALRVVSAIGPYLDCDGYRRFAAADADVRVILLIRELARGFRPDGLPRFLAWHALLETPWAKAHLETQVGDDDGVRLALEAWRARGIPGVPAECPGSSAR